MSQQMGLWWFVVPIFTIVGFAAWTYMLIRIRRHRFTKILRKEAFQKHAQSSSESPASASDADSGEPAAQDSSQEDWL